MASHKCRNGVFISIWRFCKVLKNEEENKQIKPLPLPTQKKREREKSLSPSPSPKREGSDMFSNYIVLSSHFLSTLLPSLFGEGLGERLYFPLSALKSGVNEASLQPQHRLISLIKQQVEDAHVGLKAMLLLINLIVRAGCKGGIRAWMLGTNDIAEVIDEAI